MGGSIDRGHCSDWEIGHERDNGISELSGDNAELMQTFHSKPAVAVLPSLSASKENDNASKHPLDFNLIQEFDYIQSAPEDTNNKGDGSVITFSRLKDEMGGSDLGMLGKVDGEEFLIKTGLGRGLLSQIVSHFLKKDMKSAKRKAGYIVADYMRNVYENPDKQTALQNSLKNALFDSLKIFFGSAGGREILNTATEKAIDISNVNDIHRSLVAQNPNLKNVLGVPILMDVINGTAGQQLVNDYQRTYLENHHIPHAKIFLVGEWDRKFCQRSSPSTNS